MNYLTSFKTPLIFIFRNNGKPFNFINKNVLKIDDSTLDSNKSKKTFTKHKTFQSKNRRFKYFPCNKMTTGTNELQASLV